MHSLTVRVQNWFGYLTSVAFTVAAVTAVSVLLLPQNPEASVQPVIKNLQVIKGRPNYYSTKREEYAHIKFDLSADLTSLFNWNTKQVFAWVMATYPSASTSPGAPLSQAIIWDTIINSESQMNPLNPLSYFHDIVYPQTKARRARQRSNAAKVGTTITPGKLRLRNCKPKYQITDVTGVISQQSNVTLELGWNVQPWVGALTWTMPEGYSFGRWKGVVGGRSKAFDMPALKGKPAKVADPIVSKGKAPKPAEASPII